MHHLVVAFQPIRDLRTGDVLGYEALSRFTKGSPLHWFQEAHAVGLGRELEMTALAEAVKRRRPGWGFVAINVSPTTVVDPSFIRWVGQLPEPGRTTLELTEHSVVEDYDRLRGVLRDLRSGGISIAVDDAGGGVSSFRHILTISPDTIKLDRWFIDHLDCDAGRQAFADSVVQFADRIGVQLVAEGIEREEERLACLNHGITVGQGYLLGRPATLAERTDDGDLVGH